jgi:hypothetical protein
VSKPTCEPPETIYLQVVGSDDEVNVREFWAKPFCETEGEKTWCTDRQFDSDLEYRLVRPRSQR